MIEELDELFPKPIAAVVNHKVMPQSQIIRTRIMDEIAARLQPYSKEGTQCDVDTIGDIHVIVNNILEEFEANDEIARPKVTVESHSRYVISVEAQYESIVQPVEHIDVTINIAQPTVNIAQPTLGNAFDRAMKGI